MALLSEKAFEILAGTHNTHCVSLYMPTHKSGMEINEHEDQIFLKEELQEIKRKLASYDLTETEIEEYLQPIKNLIEDVPFWRKLSNGLAIFLSKGKFEFYILPVSFKKFLYISDHFYLKPLIPLFNEDGKFFILALSLNQVKFFEATRDIITEQAVEDIIPARLEEVVGYEFEQNSLQARKVHTREGERAMFHGHGENRDKRKKEIISFLRGVDRGLMKILHDKNAPLIIASVDYFFPIYKEVSDYKYVFDKHINGNTNLEDAHVLHKKAWQLVKENFNKDKNEKKVLYTELANTKKVSYDIEKIIPAAVNGKINTLFIRNDASAYGQYDKENNKVHLHNQKQLNNSCLLNLAAVQTFLQGGKVYLMEPDEMPENGTIINAIFRY